ncbi:MAG: class I tRNA ligase family protein, partial [Calditrichia bacterium]
PEIYLAQYGSDAFRCYLMFGFEFEKGGPWSDEGIASLDRFLNRIWRLFENYEWIFSENAAAGKTGESENELNKVLHNSIKGATEDTERFHFNTAISRIMELVNGLYRYTQDRTPEELNTAFLKEVMENLLLLIAPFAPHLAEELWQRTKHEFSIFQQSWPEYREEALQEETVNYGILINGKVRSQLQVPRNMEKQEIEKRALSEGRIPELLKDKRILKIIVIPEKIVNIVVK